MYFLSINKKTDVKYVFNYNIIFFIDSVVVSVLTCYTGSQGSIPR